MAESSEAVLTARFDMLLTEEMKELVKFRGGGSYLRRLVLRDVARQVKVTGTTEQTDPEAKMVVSTYISEMERLANNG